MDTREFVLACVFVGAIAILVVLVGVLIFRIVTEAPEEDQSQRPENRTMFRITLHERCMNIIHLVLLRTGREPTTRERTAMDAASNDAAQTILDHVVTPPAQQPAVAAQSVGAPVAGQGRTLIIRGDNLQATLDGQPVVPPHNP